MERRVAELSARLDGLEQQSASPTAPQEQPAGMTRRGMLRTAAATGVGAVAGAVLVGAPAAHASAGDNMILGPNNNAGNASTGLQSAASTDAFAVSQTGAQGTAVHATTSSSTGTVILAEGLNASSAAPVLQGTSAGSGFAVYGMANGTGRAVAGYVASASSSASAVYGASLGTGYGIEGKALNGRGAKFTGRFAQITLAPGTSTTHPSHGGVAGDLYVDLNSRLWFCRGANNWVQVV
ncbi:MAG TPA: hypothetical protein VGI86_07375 [Acidimicrobiia bacterium]